MTSPAPTFPFKQRLSLRPLIEFWESMAKDGDAKSESFIRGLLSEVNANTTIGAAKVTPSDLAGHATLVDKLMSAVFPWATIDRHVAAAIVPFEVTPFYTTPSFSELDLLGYFDPETNPECPMSTDEMTVARTMKAYHLIIERLYGSETDLNLPFVVGRRNPASGLERFFQIEMDPRFVRVSVHGQKPRLSADEVQTLLNDPMNVALWASKLPPARFEFEGFGIVRATDVTNQQVLSLIKNDLLDNRDFTAEDGLRLLESHLRSYLEFADIHIGILALEDENIPSLEDTHAVGRSLLLSDARMPECPMRHMSAYAKVISSRRPEFIPDLEGSNITGLEYHVCKMGFKSLAVLPLIESDKMVGLLEVASTQKNGISKRSAFRLEGVTPLLATALNRILEEQEHRIQALIKRRYTAIHPVVEWRFREAAVEHMSLGDAVSPAKPIVFENVYPLYGLSDIRNSSTYRAEAIKEDLTEQLGLALAVIIEASSVRAQPALDELGFRLGKQIDDVSGVDTTGEETEPLRLLQEDVEPLFDQLAAISPSVAKRIAEYREAIDPALGMVYRKRKDYENAITRVNDVLSRFLEAREELAQSLVPHYFEKYRTDGVDYNIYAGSALNRAGNFDDLALRNLRLWQLMTMAGAAWEMHSLRDELPLPLDVTHLILVQSQPLAIRFRADEKKFDVDGAYNIRYEIVKKRIDKAEIRGTGERLTQPGMIAIAYSLEAERREYFRYIEYLQAAGYLEDGIETLELEPLQGVHGLRALRVRVAEEMPQADFLVNVLPASVSLSR